MADRYWVGGSGSWSDTSHWSEASGGAGGQSRPSANDNAFFDELSGGGVVDLLSDRTCKDISVTGFAGSFSESTYLLSLYGNATLSPDVDTRNINIKFIAGGGADQFIYSNGSKLSSLSLEQLSGSLNLIGDLIVTNTITLGSRTLVADGVSISCSELFSTNTNTPHASLRNCKVITYSNVTLWPSLYYDFSGTKFELHYDNTIFVRFEGVNIDEVELIPSVPNVMFVMLGNGGATFGKIKLRPVVPTQVLFANQNRIGTWDICGSADAVVTIRSATAGARRTFTLTNKAENIQYLNIKEIEELSGNKLYVGSTSVNSGDNVNVYFQDYPVTYTANPLFFGSVF